jgi:predicted transposase/invertase (TIGR01784 family)
MSNINPKIDLVFKKLFGSEENKDILLSLINSILPDYQQVVDLKIKNPYNVSDYAEGKLSILDIKAEDEQGNLYDIEMQIKGTTFYGKRTLYYWAKIFGSQLDYIKIEEEEKEKEKKKRKTYSELNKCIVISLMDFEFFDDDRYHRCFMLKDRESNEIHQDLDYLDLYFVELEKFENKYKTLKTTLDRWIKFLNNADFYSKDNLPQELAEVASIKKASEKLDVMYLNEKERGYYDAQQKRYLDEISRIQEAVDSAVKIAVETAVKEAVEQAVETAVKEAVEQAVETAVKEAVETATEQAELNSKIEIANNLILLNATTEFISQATNLTYKQIEQLRHEK